MKAEEEKWSGEVAALKAQLRELQQQQQAVVVVPSIVDNSTSSGVAGVASMHASNYNERANIQNYDMLGMTEMYDRIVQMDRELFAERGKRKEVEMYLQQILKDVESKAPILASQRRDYYRIIESHASLANRLDLLVQENSDLKHAVDAFRRDSSEAREESHALSIHNSDLSQQVQHLLRMSLDIGRRSTHSDAVAVGSRRAVVEATDDEEEEGDSNPQDVISEFLVTFDDIVGLQRKNAELLRVVRKLSKEPALMLLGDGDGEGGSSSSSSTTPANANASSASAQKDSSTSRALQAAMEELSAMREARQRTEEMVVVLAQQRDMYRSMVEGEPNLFPQSNLLLRSPGSAQSDMQATGSSSSNIGGSGTLGAISLRELQAKLAQAEEEKKR